MLRPWVLLAAALVSSPALYGGLVTGSLDADQALLRFLIAVPVCAMAFAVLRGLVGSAAPPEGEILGAPRRRAQDAAHPNRRADDRDGGHR